MNESSSPAQLNQRGRLAFLLKDSVLYGGAAALSRACSLITFPLIARHFSPGEYGTLDFLGVIVTFLGVFVIFGQDSAVARFFYEHESPEARRDLISQSLAFQVGLLAVMVLAMGMSAQYLGPKLIDRADGKYLIGIAALQCPATVLFNFCQNLLKWTFKRKQFVILSLGSTAMAVILIVVGVTFLKVGVAGLLLINLVNTAAFALLGLWFLREWLVVPRDARYLREMFPYALPMGLICSLGAVVPTLERGLVTSLLGSDRLGLYAAGVRLAGLVTLLVSAFQTAWGPFSLSLHKRSDAIQTYNLVLKLFVMAMGLVAFALAAISVPFMRLLAGERYVDGMVVVFPLALALTVQATSWITEIGVTISKRSHLSLYSHILHLLVTVGAIYGLVAWLGLVGVALGVLAGHLVKAVMATWIAQRAHPLPWVFKPVALFFSGSLAYGCLATMAMKRHGPEAGMMWFSLGFVVFAIVGYMLLFTPTERNGLLQMVRAKIGAKPATLAEAPR